MGSKWTEYCDQAVKGAMPELIKMREEGIIKGWGLGVNTIPPILKTLEQSDPDVFISACNYSLIDHEELLNTVLPVCEKKGGSIIAASPLNNGFLTGRDRYNYTGKPTAAQIEKRDKLTAVCKKHNVDLRTAALQFCAAPKVVSAIIPGARRAHQPEENVISMNTKIPSALWKELKQENLISAKAPTP